MTLVIMRARFLTFSLPLVFCLLLSGASCSSPEDDSEPASETTGGGQGGSSTGEKTEAEVCTLGDAAEQCGGEPTKSCSPFLIATDDSCDEDDDCPDEALCFESSRFEDSAGECYSLIAECVARCAGDLDCPESTFCDQSSGECVDAEPQGLELGQSCEPDGAACLGTCVEVGENIFECEEHCRVGDEQGCGVSDLSEAGLACAFFAYDLDDFGIEQGIGDTGVCARLCDCDADCPGDQLCWAAPQGGYAGVCVGGIDEVDSIPSCSSEGAGGATP